MTEGKKVRKEDITILNNQAEKKKKFLDLFEKVMGNITMACKGVPIVRETYYRWCREDAEFKASCEDVEEGLLDFAETMLQKKIRDGATAELLFFLKTKGKKRGYIERNEFEFKPNTTYLTPEERDRKISDLQKKLKG